MNFLIPQNTLQKITRQRSNPLQEQMNPLEQKAKSMVGLKKHKFESKNDYVDYPCPRCGAHTNRDGSYCWQVKMKQLKQNSSPPRMKYKPN